MNRRRTRSSALSPNLNVSSGSFLSSLKLRVPTQAFSRQQTLRDAPLRPLGPPWVLLSVASTITVCFKEDKPLSSVKRFVSKAVALQGLQHLAAHKTLSNSPDAKEISRAVALSPLILKMLHACEVTA
jgi:hypothetical protein